MPLKPSKDQKTYLYDTLESAQKALGYVQGVSYDEFWQNSEKRDAVAMRIAAIGEAARQITPVTETVVPNVPFHLIRGMRNRIAHHYIRWLCRPFKARFIIQTIVPGLRPYFTT